MVPYHWINPFPIPFFPIHQDGKVQTPFVFFSRLRSDIGYIFITLRTLASRLLILASYNIMSMTALKGNTNSLRVSNMMLSSSCVDANNNDNNSLYQIFYRHERVKLQQQIRRGGVIPHDYLFQLKSLSKHRLPGTRPCMLEFQAMAATLAKRWKAMSPAQQLAYVRDLLAQQRLSTTAASASSSASQGAILKSSPNKSTENNDDGDDDDDEEDEVVIVKVKEPRSQRLPGRKLSSSFLPTGTTGLMALALSQTQDQQEQPQATTVEATRYRMLALRAAAIQVVAASRQQKQKQRYAATGSSASSVLKDHSHTTSSSLCSRQSRDRRPRSSAVEATIRELSHPVDPVVQRYLGAEANLPLGTLRALVALQQQQL